MLALPKPHLIQPIRDNIKHVHDDVLQGNYVAEDVHAMHASAQTHGVTSAVQDLLDKLDHAVRQHKASNVQPALTDNALADEALADEALADEAPADKQALTSHVNVDQELQEMTQKLSLNTTHPKLVRGRMRGMGGRMGA